MVLRTRRPQTSIPQTPLPQASGVDNAWRTLQIVTDWIKHAEAKAAVMLTAAGVIGGILYSLVSTAPPHNLPFDLTASLCALLTAGSAMATGMALRPRRKNIGQPPNLLFFEHVAHAYRSPEDGYTEALSRLLVDDRTLTAAVAEQIWANAHVARRKYFWSGVGTVLLLCALAAVALTAALGVLGDAT
ncbi:Pycsar system effector family protein [Streptomyces europaeiscabiei]|uniref:Pycsar system effector family protein n=1 Tax=Streptomyces europaeiscabiei TaxID=146819 RepID=UPI0038F64072